ncbi:MAG: transposase family protein [Methylococcales bacterium]
MGSCLESFAREKLDWLRQFVPLKNGVPSHDCIAYTLSRVSVKGFQGCFGQTGWRGCGNTPGVKSSRSRREDGTRIA